MGSFALGYLAAGLGAGLAVIGAGFGIGKIGADTTGFAAGEPCGAPTLKS